MHYKNLLTYLLSLLLESWLTYQFVTIFWILLDQVWTGKLFLTILI